MASGVQDGNGVFALGPGLINEALIYDLLHGNGAYADYSHYASGLVEMHNNNNGPAYKMLNYNNNNNNVTVIDCHLQEMRRFETESTDGMEKEGSAGEDRDSPDSRLNMYKPYVMCDAKNHNRSLNCHRQSPHYSTSSSGGSHHHHHHHHSNNINRMKKKYGDVMERRAHGLMERFKSRGEQMRIGPEPPSHLYNGGPWDGLNEQMWRVCAARIQTETTYVNKLQLWKRVFLHLRRSFDNYSLFLVGSTMSGFALEGSDIDMCLLTRPFLNDPRIDSLHHLAHMKHLLLESGLASKAELISAKVPILKFENRETGFKVDLNCNNGVGIRNTHMLHCYGQLDWRVRPLIAIVKVWAQANNINDAKSMTVSSYSWSLMVIHYLQCGVSPALLPCVHTAAPDYFNITHENEIIDVQEFPVSLRNYESENTSCLGDLFIGFLHYYTFFGYDEWAISVRCGARIPIDQCKYLKAPKNDPGQWKCLCIEEPFDCSNTARSVFDPNAFKHIRDIISASYKELARNKTLSFVLPVNLQRQIHR